MPEIKIDQIVLFAAFLFPGFVSISIYRIRLPHKEAYFKDQVLEAFCFSLVNFAIIIWPAYELSFLSPVEYSWILSWIVILMGFVIMPFLLGWFGASLIEWAGTRGWIPVSAKTAFDWAFKSKVGCWVKVRLADGSWVGGRFDKQTNSYASAYPEPGHLYIGELWALDAEGNFTEKLKDGPGIVLRPNEYRYLFVYLGDGK
jgi:hypothetical protein